MRKVAMKPLLRVHRLIDQIATFPPLRTLLEARYEREFAGNVKANLFRGVFETFEAAQASAPESRPAGYDNPNAASMYLERTKVIYPADYPVMFWLEKVIGEGCRKIFDLGGHIGVSYYAYRRHISYPQDLRWTVFDVPAVVAKGREQRQAMDSAGQLDFTKQFEDSLGADVVTAIGSLQYLPDTLAERLKRVDMRPRHLLLSLVPAHLERSCFTLQSIGTAFCPYRIFGMEEFIKSFEAVGYSLVDRWENVEKGCHIPFRPNDSLDRYYGFYFRHAES
jgi:putative methyltransferase (TIGR04325 family)